jgi:hypothetical protein
MRNFILLISVFAASSCRGQHASSQNTSIEIKKLVIGKWVLVNDKKFIIHIKEDTMIYYYKGKISDKNPIVFSFGDSLLIYKNKNNVFNFMKKNGEIYPGVIIKEYDSFSKDTILNTIVDISKDGMGLMARDRYVNFKKLK